MVNLFGMNPHASAILPLLFQSIAAAVIPEPQGPYAVLHNTAKLIDRSRADPLVPEYQQRDIFISSFYPVERSSCGKKCTVPYIPSKVLPFFDRFMSLLQVPAGSFDDIEFDVCCETSDEAPRVSEVPLVLLLHGLGGTRMLHNAMARELASEGYAVVTLDHTFESVAIDVGGNVIPSLNRSSWYTSDPEALNPLHAARVDDANFVLSELGRKEIAAELVPGATSGFNTERAAVFGHSFGGSASIGLIMGDSPFLGGMNMDGNQWDTITDIHRPAVLFGTTGVTPIPHNTTTDPSWAEVWEHLKDWRAEIGLANVTHFIFTDAPHLYGTGVLDLPEEIVEDAFGLLDPNRSYEVIQTYVKAFFNFVLKDGDTKLFDGPSEDFPEIVVY